MDVHGDASAISYTPKNGTAASYDAIVGLEELERRETPEGEQLYHTRMVWVNSNDLASPKVNARVATGGNTYQTEEIKTAVGQMIGLKLVRSAAKEVSRPDYRKSR